MSNKLTDADFAAKTLGKKCLVKMSAPWCAPCRTIAPVLEKVSEATGIELFEVDTDEQQATAELFGIRSLPTVIALDNGQPIDQLVGAQSEAKYMALAQKLS